jgi:MoaA/NifB/PqqE/SkfB family radical SAM enzyme
MYKKYNLIFIILKIKLLKIGGKMNSKTINLAINNLKSIIYSDIYLKTGIDFTYPTQIYAQVNDECNSKCVMCDVWRKNENELPASTWIDALERLRNKISNYKICFAGGEVFLKKDVYEIFKYCNKNKIVFGITTNGILFNEENINKFLSLNPYNINISLDSLDSEIYKKIRGVNALETVLSNIKNILEYKKTTGNKVIITIKTVVNSYNIKELTNIARFAQEMGMNGVTYDIIKKRRKHFQENKVEDFEKIYNLDKELLNSVSKELIKMKSNGYKIFNSEENIRQWKNYDKKLLERICNIPLRNLYIFTSGNVQFCDYSNDVVGYIQDDDIDKILNSKLTNEIKKNHVNCQNPCVYCMKRSFKDYINIFKSFVK